MRLHPDQSFLTTLHRHEPVTIQDLCEATGVTATAVRQRLVRLHAEGLVRRQLARQERGRPHYTYTITSEGLKLLGDQHGEMAALLWREIMLIEHPEVKRRILASVRQTLVERFGTSAQGEPLAERMQGMCHTLAEFGFDMEYLPASSATGSEDQKQTLLPVLREYNCPYHEIAEETTTICEFEQSVFAEMLGVPVELAACRLNGNRCCEFQVGSTVSPEEPSIERRSGSVVFVGTRS